MYSKLETNIMDGYLGFFSNLDRDIVENSD